MIDTTKIKDAGHAEKHTKEKTLQWLCEISNKCEELNSILRDQMPLYAYKKEDEKLEITFPDTLFAIAPLIAVLRYYGSIMTHRMMSLKGTEYAKEYIKSFERLVGDVLDKTLLEKILVETKQVPPMEIMTWAANEMSGGATEKTIKATEK